MTEQENGDDKLRELVLYISSQSAEDSKFGVTKLSKALFFSDFTAYDQLGESITGEHYMRLEYGPVPERLSIAQEMIQNGDLESEEIEYYGFRQRRLIPLREADLSSFSEDELRIVDEVLASLDNLNASDLTNLTHDFIGWQLADSGERIPYPTVFLSHQPVTRGDRRRARELVKEYGW